MQGNIYMTQTHCKPSWGWVLPKSRCFCPILGTFAQFWVFLPNSGQNSAAAPLFQIPVRDALVWLPLFARPTPLWGSAAQSSDLFLQRHQYWKYHLLKINRVSEKQEVILPRHLCHHSKHGLYHGTHEGLTLTLWYQIRNNVLEINSTFMKASARPKSWRHLKVNISRTIWQYQLLHTDI